MSCVCGKCGASMGQVLILIWLTFHLITLLSLCVCAAVSVQVNDQSFAESFRSTLHKASTTENFDEDILSII